MILYFFSFPVTLEFSSTLSREDKGLSVGTVMCNEVGVVC